MSRSRSATVLVVDDLEAARILLRKQLSNQGHTVLEASDGAEALHLVRRRNGQLDLVLTDVVMPGMNGTELADQLCAEFPQIPVILMSAYAPAGLARVGLRQAIIPVLQKPFDAPQLSELVAMALSQAAERRVLAGKTGGR